MKQDGFKYPDATQDELQGQTWSTTLISEGKRKLTAESKFTAEGKISTVLLVWHNDEPQNSYWGLPQALEAYNKL